jgi:hypothetical protein
MRITIEDPSSIIERTVRKARYPRINLPEGWANPGDKVFVVKKDDD